jgi:anti-anti-sigma factor
MMSQHIQLTDQGNQIWVLRLIQDVDSRDLQFTWDTEAIPMLQDLIQNKAKKLIVDLTETQQLGSPGIQLLVNMYRKLSQQDIPIILKNPNPHLQRLLRIMQLDRIFVIKHEPQDQAGDASPGDLSEA